MKTFLNSTKDIEDYLFGNKAPEEALVFEAHTILQSELAENTGWQKKTYALIKAYSQKKLKAEIEAVHQQLFSEKKHQGFRRRIASLFLRR